LGGKPFRHKFNSNSPYLFSAHTFHHLEAYEIGPLSAGFDNFYRYFFGVGLLSLVGVCFCFVSHCICNFDFQKLTK
jgi:hypothetical protein